MRTGLRKAESSLAIQLPTEKIEVAYFSMLAESLIRPPRHTSVAGDGGDPKHLIFCPNRALKRRKLYEEVGTQRYEGILSTTKVLRAVAK